MRTSALACFLGLTLIGCVGVIDGGEGGGDDVGPSASCGDGTINAGESCDDGNNISGDGCSASCTVEEIVTPRVEMVIDKPTLMTELATTNLLTVTLAAADGFSGPVNLTATALDAANEPMAGWTVAIQPAVVTLPENGILESIVTMTVPSTNRGLLGSIKIDATATGVTIPSVTSTVTTLNQLTIPMTTSNGQCVYPAAGTLNVTVGTRVRWLNNSTQNLVVHVTGNGTGMAHQDTAQSADQPAVTVPGGTYEQTVTGVSPEAGGSWYCHAPGPTVQTLRIRGVAAQ